VKITAFLSVIVFCMSLHASHYRIESATRHSQNDKIIVVETKLGKRLWLLSEDETKRDRAVEFFQRRLGSKLKINDKKAKRVIKAKSVNVFSDEDRFLGNLAKVSAKKN